MMFGVNVVIKLGIMMKDGQNAFISMSLQL